MIDVRHTESSGRDVLWAATRKGLFKLLPDGDGNGKNSKPWRIAQLSFVGQPVTMILPDPRDGTLYAALNLGHFGVKLHRSDDGGNSWTEIAVPAYPKSEDNGSPAIAVADVSPEPAAPEPTSSSSDAAVNAPPAGPCAEANLVARGRWPDGGRWPVVRDAPWRIVFLRRSRRQLVAEYAALGRARAQRLVRRRLRYARHPFDLR